MFSEFARAIRYTNSVAELGGKRMAWSKYWRVSLRFRPTNAMFSENGLCVNTCGDYALFMSGIFRNHVQGKGSLDYYIQEGSRSY